MYVGGYVLRDVRRIQLRKDLDFLLDIFYLVFCTLEINDFDSHGLLGSLVIAAVGLGVR